MSGHRHYRRRRSSSGSRSTFRSSMRASITRETDGDVQGGHRHRRQKRSSPSSPVCSPASHHSWVLLNRDGARLDGFPGDSTTSSRTSVGDEISVSFELVEPPGISVLLIHSPRASTTTTTQSKSIVGNVIAAHRNVVLLAITSDDDVDEDMSPTESVVDLFVHQASRRLPSLMLVSSTVGGSEMYWHLKAMGIMSCTNNDDNDSPSFVVANLDISPVTNVARLFRSFTGQWESFENLHVHGANGGHDLRWWKTDGVVTYGHRYMIWVDYYRGMVIMDLSSETLPPSSPLLPRLRYVPLPVNRVEDPEHMDFGTRGCPKDSRSMCVTRYGIKFVSIDRQHWSNFGLGNPHVLDWNHRFRISTWSLREHDYTWRRDATMHEQEFRDVYGFRDRFGFQHLRPKFPVIDMDNPDVVVFRLEKDGYDPDEPKWMIEVDLRKKVLLAATSYAKKRSDGLSGDAETINSARISRYNPISSELPRYMDGRQACKKRRQ